MKKSLIFSVFLSLIFLMQFVASQSLMETISSTIDPGTVTLAILFVIFFAALYYSTSRIFKGNKPVAAVIAIAISLLAIYWMNQTQNIGGLISGLGISDNVLYTIFPIAIIAAIIILANVKTKSGKKFGFGGVLIIFGAAIILIVQLTSIVYEKDIATIIGAVMIGLGIFLIWRRKKKPSQAINPPSRKKWFSFSGPRQNWVNMEQARKNRAEEEAEIAARMNRERKREKEIQTEIKTHKVQAEQEAQQEVKKERLLLTRDEETLSRTLRNLIQEYNQIQTQDPSNPRLRDLIQDMNNIRAEMRKLNTNQQPLSSAQENEIQKEVLMLENKAQSDEAVAMQTERGDIQTATERMQMARAEEQKMMRERQQAFEMYKQEYDSYKREYDGIMQEYNRLIKYDSQNPRIQKLANDAQMITNEVNRIKAEMDRLEQAGL